MKESHYKTLEFMVDGMDCADCALRIEKKVSQLLGIKFVRVNFLSSRLKVEMGKNGPTENEIHEAVKAAGYSLRSASPIRQDYFLVEGLTITETGTVIERKLKEIPGIKNLKIDYSKKQLLVEHRLSPEQIINLIKNTGFPVKLLTQKDTGKTHDSPQNQKMLVLTMASGILAFAGLAAKQLSIANYLPTILFCMAILLGGFHIILKGWKEAVNLTLGMNFLMSIAVMGAVILGQWSEAAMVIFLFSLANLLESYSIQRARRSIASLINLAPNTAFLKTFEEIREVPVEQIVIGDVILIKPGNRIPLDGEVTAGSSLVDQAPITGESVPSQKSIGDEVFAGSMNQQGILEVKVNRPYQDSTLAKIIHLVEEAQSQRAPIQQFVEKFTRYYTPIVVAMAIGFAIIPPILMGGSFSEWFYRALVLLVISCPCALVISTPVTLVSALTNAARHGILVKGGNYLENFHKVKILAFDKTGTLTYGQPSVQTIVVLNNHSEKKILQIAASIESNSEHAVARAIIRYAQDQGIQLELAKNFQAIPGRGARADISGNTYYIGNHKLFEENGWCQDKVHEHLTQIENLRYTAVLVGNQKQLIGVIALADEVRLDAAQAIQKLQQSGIERTVMLTGDNEMTAESISQKVGIPEYYSELLPVDKVSTINHLKENGKLVGMVGDGINDAPALAAANIGISMGASGSDTAIETADIALMKDDLNKIAYLKVLSKKTVKIIQQNIFVSLFLKFIFFILAIPGLATLWMAVFADMGASLMVIFNGLRLLNLKDN
jgi:Cd2+/Zn2+-exporting ATPase